LFLLFIIILFLLELIYHIKHCILTLKYMISFFLFTSYLNENVYKRSQEWDILKWILPQKFQTFFFRTKFINFNEEFLFLKDPKLFVTLIKILKHSVQYNILNIGLTKSSTLIFTVIIPL
jgi:hypothetical protein